MNCKMRKPYLLYRAPKIQLKPLNQLAIINKYKNIFGTDRDTAEKMAELTKGYPFAFQVLGYLTWNHSGHYEVVIDEYEQYLSEFVYDKIWSELSQKDRIVARELPRRKAEKSKRSGNILAWRQTSLIPTGKD